jgi:hypothetical protein
MRKLSILLSFGLLAASSLAVCSLAACSKSTPPASAPTQGQAPSGGTGENTGTPGGTPTPPPPPAAANPAKTTAPVLAGMLVIHGLGPTYDAVLKQLGPIAPLPPQAALQSLLIQMLGAKNGKSLDFTKPAGEIMAANGIEQMNASYVAFIGAVSEDALKADLTPTKDGKGFVLPAMVPAGILRYSGGALVYASDEAFLDSVSDTIAKIESDTSSQPGVTVTIHVADLARAHLGAHESSLTGYTKDVVEESHAYLNAVDTATINYVPDGDTLTLTADLAPTKGASLTLPTTPAPDGAAIPGDFLTQTVYTLPGGLSAVAHEWLYGYANEDAAKKLAPLATGVGQFGMTVSDKGPEIVDVTSYSDSTQAYGLLQTLAADWHPFQGPPGPGPGASGTKVEKDVTKIDGVPVTRVTATIAPGMPPFITYIACPPKACVIAMSPTEALAKGRLAVAMVGIAGKGLAMLSRSGVKESAALAGGDASHGFAYQDLAAVADLLLMGQLQGQAKASPPPMASLTKKAAIGIVVGQSGDHVTLTGATSVSALSALMTAAHLH